MNKKIKETKVIILIIGMFLITLAIIFSQFTKIRTDVNFDNVCKYNNKEMTIEDATEIAQNSEECSKYSLFLGNSICNENSGTWWIDLDIEKKGCKPACIVNIINKTASINWRCTELISQP